MTGTVQMLTGEKKVVSFDTADQASVDAAFNLIAQADADKATTLSDGKKVTAKTFDPEKDTEVQIVAPFAGG